MSRTDKERNLQWRLTNHKKLLMDFIEKETDYAIEEKEYGVPPYFRYAIFKNGEQITDYFDVKATAICNLINFEEIEWFYDEPLSHPYGWRF